MRALCVTPFSIPCHHLIKHLSHNLILKAYVPSHELRRGCLEGIPLDNLAYSFSITAHLQGKILVEEEDARIKTGQKRGQGWQRSFMFNKSGFADKIMGMPELELEFSDQRAVRWAHFGKS
jgi:hypothetical protein